MLRLTKIKLVENKNNELDDSFTETYVQAQYLYSQLLREKYVNRHHSLHLLRKYLDKYFYKAMVKEIKLKISQGTIDDTVVNNIEVVKYAKLDENLIITQLNVNGQDKEVQFNEGFEDSFARDTWSDYVIFGKTKSGQYKIISLVYGEHFHLNGRDYNRQRNLRHTQYFERRK